MDDSPFKLDTGSYSQLLQMDTSDVSIVTAVAEIESLPVLLRDIECSFEDGKKPVSYSIIVHVKQPVRGRRKAFTGINNVGHTFITLIKLNSDNSYVSRSFGFYPAKKMFLFATPLHPGDNPVFKDDAMHNWDQTVSKFISEKKFKEVLENFRKFGNTQYNLNRNNCTDFGLGEAVIAGINIRETVGRWPLGKGNNPANAGQSLLERKFNNDDAEYPDTLVVNEGEGLIDESNL